MKHLMIPFALFSLNLLFSAPAKADFKFQQGQFSISATLKDNSTTPATVTPLFTLKGSALWTIDLANYNSETAQVTIQRKTFPCDETYSYTDYRCEIDNTKFQQMLDDLVRHDANFLKAQDIIKRYYDNSYYSDNFKINLGRQRQTSPGTEKRVLDDPDNDNLSVEFETTNYGMQDM